MKLGKDRSYRANEPAEQYRTEISPAIYITASEEFKGHRKPDLTNPNEE